VILPNCRSKTYPDFEMEPDDINDCMNWAVNRSKQPGNTLSGKIDETKQAVGGVSAGGVMAAIATAKNNTDSTALIKYNALMCFDPGDINGLSQYYAPMITTATVTIFGESTLCNLFTNGVTIFHKVAGPAYGMKVKGADHCDIESSYNLLCSLICGSPGWEECHNKSFRRYGTAFLEAYLKCDPSAFLYINGSIAQADGLIELFTNNRDLEMPNLGVSNLAASVLSGRLEETTCLQKSGGRL
jgi:hypothetical protein